ncbi:MAG: hypothetical protein JWM31_685, partial [Solirubrobacterales bacterium]|nr:hypothetical protein [Solirubrobacterales bacterium]
YDTSMRRLLLAAVTTAALAALLLGPAGASAGVPVTIGNAASSTPTVTAGFAPGVFHVVFNDAGADVFRYCQVQLPEPGCAKSAVIPFTVLGPSGAPFHPGTAWIVIDPIGGRPLRLIHPEYISGNTYESDSIDDGTTWTPFRQVHTGGNRVGEGRPVLEANRGTALVPRTGLDGLVLHDTSDGTSKAEATLATPTIPYNPSLATVNDGTVATIDTLENVYSWFAPAGSPLIAAPSWGTIALVGKGQDSTMAGAGGTAFLASTKDGVAGPLEIRRWGGLAFGPPTTITAAKGYVADVAVTPKGVPGVVYRDNGHGLTFATPDTRGRYDPRVIVHDDEVFGHVNVAYDDAGFGLAVWPRDASIVAADVTEVRDPSLPNRAVTVTKNKLTLGLNTSGSCVLPGRGTTVGVGGQGAGKVTRVTFRLGGKTITDRTPNYSARFTVPQSAGAGDRIQVTATASIERRTAPKRFTLLITSSVDVCGG